MSQFFQRYATPLITGLFIVSLISGIALFFHVGPSGFHGMHEWLSMVLIVPFVLHLWKNWRPFLALFRRVPMTIALVASAVAAGFFLLPVGGGSEGAGGPPPFQLAHRVLSRSISEVAPAVGTTVEDLTKSLSAAGLVVGDPSQKLSDVAASSGKSDADVIRALLAAGAPAHSD